MAKASKDLTNALGIRTPEETEQEPTSAPSGKLGDLGNRFARGLLGTVSATAKTIGEFGFDDPDNNAFSKFGEFFDTGVRSTFQTDPDRDEDFTSKLAEGAGSLASFAVPGGAVGALGKAASLAPKAIQLGQTAIATTLGAALSSNQAVEDYKKSVAEGKAEEDPEVRKQVAGIGALIGTTEGVPFGRALGRFAKKPVVEAAKGSAIGKVAKETLKGGLEEGAQEAFQSTALNILAQQKHDSDREILEGAGEGAAVGGVLGAALSAITAGLGVRRSMGDVHTYRDAVNQVQKKISESTGKPASFDQAAKLLNSTIGINDEGELMKVAKTSNIDAITSQAASVGVAEGGDPTLAQAISEGFEGAPTEIAIEADSLPETLPPTEGIIEGTTPQGDLVQQLVDRGTPLEEAQTLVNQSQGLQADQTLEPALLEAASLDAQQEIFKRLQGPTEIEAAPPPAQQPDTRDLLIEQMNQRGIANADSILDGFDSASLQELEKSFGLSPEPFPVVEFSEDFNVEEVQTITLETPEVAELQAPSDPSPDLPDLPGIGVEEIAPGTENLEVNRQDVTFIEGEPVAIPGEIKPTQVLPTETGVIEQVADVPTADVQPDQPTELPPDGLPLESSNKPVEPQEPIAAPTPVPTPQITEETPGIEGESVLQPPSQETLTKTDGSGFKTERAAKAAATRNKAQEFSVVPAEDGNGFVVRMGSTEAAPVAKKSKAEVVQTRTQVQNAKEKNPVTLHSANRATAWLATPPQNLSEAELSQKIASIQDIPVENRLRTDNISLTRLQAELAKRTDKPVEAVTKSNEDRARLKSRLTIAEYEEGVRLSGQQPKKPSQRTRNIFMESLGNLRQATRHIKDLRIIYVENVSEIADQDMIDAMRRNPPSMVAAGFIKNDTKDVYFVGDNIASPEHLRRVIMHEVVGHLGMRTMFGENWNNALDRIYRDIKDTPDFAVVGRTYFAVNPKLYDPNTTDGQRRLTDEYLAKLAEDPNVDKSVWKKLKETVQAFLKLLGVTDTKITDAELKQILSVSMFRTFNKPVKGAHPVFDANQSLDSIEQTGLDGELLKFSLPEALEQEKIPNTSPTLQEDMTQRVSREVNALNSIQDVFTAEDFKSTWQKKVDKGIKWIESKTVFGRYGPYKRLAQQDLLTAARSMRLGDKDKGERLARRVSVLFSKLPKKNKDLLYDYFKTKDFDEKRLNTLGSEAKSLAIEAKAELDRLGQELIRLGLLTSEQFEANRGEYLPRLYLQHVVDVDLAGVGGLSGISDTAYTKKLDKSLSPELRKLVKGEIKDPTILVAESITKISRDIALFDFMNDIHRLSLTKDPVTGKNVAQRPWVWTPEIIQWRGQTLSLAGVQENIKSVKKTIEKSPELNDRERKEAGVLLKELEELEATTQETRQQQLSAFKEQNGFSDTDVDDYLRENFKSVPLDPRKYGMLAGMRIRKELYNDLVGNFVNVGHDGSTWDKWMNPQTGRVAKFTQMWKFSKTVANLPTQVRNFVGNWVLLDISTGTNSVHLTDDLIGLLNHHMKGDKDKGDWGFWLEEARRMGLHATTFSNTELNLVRKKWETALQQSVLRDKKDDGGIIGKTFFFMKEKFIVAAQAAGDLYQGSEELYKTVKFRDHIRWLEEKTGKKYKSLDIAERNTWAGAGAAESQRAILDYSSVPNTLRHLRSAPIGAPFITFTYKALPRVLEGMARHPQKFIKYAALPYILTEAFQAIQGVDDDDMEKILASQPKWQKENPGSLIMPWRDSNGKIQSIDISPFVPWAMFIKAGQTMMNVDTSSFSDSITSAGRNSVKTLFDAGILSGPVPSMLSMVQTGIDPFTEREVINPSDPAEVQLANFATYLSNMMLPTFMTDMGFAGKLQDYFGDNLNRYGTKSITGTQTIGRAVGVNITGFDPNESFRSNLAFHQREILNARVAKAKALRDKNLGASERQELAKKHNVIIQSRIATRADFVKQAKGTT